MGAKVAFQRHSQTYIRPQMHNRRPPACQRIALTSALAVMVSLCTISSVFGQTGNRAMGNAIGWVEGPKAHGKWYAHWGYHRAEYGKSDVHLIGPSIDFTLHDVKATDMPSAFDPKVHLNPAAFTIPQFNARIGRKIRDGIAVPGDFWISAGWDHLKYKVPHTIHQVSGFIDSLVYAPQTSFDWAWRDFNFEHSDGMNFIRIAAERTSVLVGRPGPVKHGTPPTKNGDLDCKQRPASALFCAPLTSGGWAFEPSIIGASPVGA